MSAVSGPTFGLPVCFSISSGKNDGLDSREGVGGVAARHTESRRSVVRRVAIAVGDDGLAELLHLEPRGRVVLRVAPSQVRAGRLIAVVERERARIARCERHDQKRRALEQLRRVRRAGRALEAAADAHLLRRAPVEQRLVRTGAAGGLVLVVRVAVAELEVQLLGRGHEQLAVELRDLGRALRVVRREQADRIVGNVGDVIDRVVAEVVLAVGDTGREPDSPDFMSVILPCMFDSMMV